MSTRRLLNRYAGLLYVTPAILTIIGVMAFPLVYTFFLSFQKSDVFTTGFNFIGFSQFVELFNDPIFFHSLRSTFTWTAGSVVFQFLIGFIAAVFINQHFVKAKTLMRILLMVPWVLPGVVGAMVWKWSYHPDFGIINYVLEWLGIISANINWVSGKDTALWSAIVVNVWKMFPFVMLMIEASLQSVPKELKDASRVDGASNLRAFFTVTIPHISSTCYTVILLLIIWTFNAFTFIYVLTQGGPAHSSEILPMYIYRQAFQNYNFGFASTASVVLFLITAVFSIIYVRMFLKGDD